jgi:hypothetical protein
MEHSVRATVNGARAKATLPASAGDLPPTPAFPVAGSTTAPWREQALTKVTELHTLTLWLRRRSPDSALANDLSAAIGEHLRQAKTAAETSQTWRERWRSWATGLDVERATSNLDAAEATLLRLAPTSYVRGEMPSLQAHIRAHLPADDPRRRRVEAIARQVQQRDLEEVEQGAIVAAVHAANSEARREVRRLRSFRNVLLISATLLTIAAVGIGVLGATSPRVIPLCFAPNSHVVCPTAEKESAAPVPDAEIRSMTSEWDLPLIQLVGLIAAAVAGAVALRSIRGTSTPYSLPVALALLKLPTGALTAVLGLLLMRGEFVPGLSALDTSGQIIAWAVVFGYAQQLFTRLVDQRAQTVLNAVGGAGGAPAGTP